MTTETILTHQQVLDICRKYHPNEDISLAKAIEQAVLQSPEIQRLRIIEAQAERIVSRCEEDGNYLVLTADLYRLRDALERENGK